MSEKDEKHAQQDFDLRWTANSMYSGKVVPDPSTVERVLRLLPTASLDTV